MTDLTTNDDINLSLTSDDDTINALSGNDWLELTGNNNTINGGLGNDKLRVVLGAGNILNGDEGDDTLTGGGSADILNGGADNDRLEGGGGDDTLTGGIGDDTYVLNGQGTDTIVENAGEGKDTIFITGGLSTFSLAGYAGIDNLTGDEGNDILYNLTGNDLDNIITGGVFGDTLNGGLGNDRLDGRSGDDNMTGGDGDDTFVIDSANDVITEIADEGNDTVETGLFSLDLANFAHIENLTLTGSTELDLAGNGSDNVLTGNSVHNTLQGNGGDDTLIGGGGDDTLMGGEGGDIYDIDTAGDQVIDFGGTGTDTIRSSAINVSIASNSAIENAEVYGALNLNVTGNAGANALDGNDGSNVITGGLGKDTMTGGAMRDVFDFNSKSDTGRTALARDVITDFVRGLDDIDLRTIDANSKKGGNQNFKFIGTQKFHKIAGELHYFKSGGNTIVEGDTNGDGRADFQIELSGSMNLSAGDFIL